MASILIIDKDHRFAESVCDTLAAMGQVPSSAHTLRQGIARAGQGDYDLILLDVCLPDGNGLEAIEQLRGLDSEPQIIIIADQGDPDGAESALHSGAWCYLEKQAILEELSLTLSRVLQYRQTLRSQRATMKAVEREQLVGESPAFLQSLELLGKAAFSDANVLLSGESGTGKEAFARAVHANSRRKQANFVVVDCAALPEQLVESVLFGHVRGAFTGADRANRGLVRHADRGTLFLDEIGELPLAMQKSFLRVLQERCFCPVGSYEEQASDFRLIAATNCDLAAMTEQGLFREDLFHRLRGIHIQLPPLRERNQDIRLLSDYFLERLSRRYGQEKKEYLTDFIEHLSAYPWPGNVRELSHAIESSFVEAVHSPLLFTQHLPLYIRTAYARSRVEQGSPPCPQVDAGEGELPAWRDARSRFEEGYLHRLLAQTQGNISEAGRVSGLSRTRLYQLLKKYQLSLSTP
ncbi:sigma-54-dependent transcriptional regulator [Desulfogranum mediterraneum]|uniref:sigma-54-dependent transcriptional regulator n=1 Tax=Desulfogranum mediterraneum TaxID=160661 RepID=UPI0004084A18|nr:sigma-54 dependent transcriptional regulator [Desulfogranum mediterraneum]